MEEASIPRRSLWVKSLVVSAAAAPSGSAEEPGRRTLGESGRLEGAPAKDWRVPGWPGPAQRSSLQLQLPLLSRAGLEERRWRLWRRRALLAAFCNGP